MEVCLDQDCLTESSSLSLRTCRELRSLFLLFIYLLLLLANGLGIKTADKGRYQPNPRMTAKYYSRYHLSTSGPADWLVCLGMRGTHYIC